MPIFKLIVLGSGYGESILVYLPGEKWGIVDCWFDELGYSEFKNILIKQQIKQFEFLCLTHFHLDHYQGMWKIIEDFAPKQFWYPDIKQDVLKRYHAYISATGKGGSQENSLKSDELKKLILSLKKHSILRKTIKASPSAIYNDGLFKIFALSPSQKSLDSFATGKFDKENLLSITLVLEFPDKRILLGGDTESNEWKYILNDTKEYVTCVPFVKISHHGSEQGMGPIEWDCYTNCQPNQNHIGLLTPNLATGLPKICTIEQLAKRKNLQILTTAETGTRMERYHFPENYSLEQKNQLISNFNHFILRKFKNSGWYLEMDTNGELKMQPSGNAIKYP